MPSKSILTKPCAVCARRIPYGAKFPWCVFCIAMVKEHKIQVQQEKMKQDKLKQQQQQQQQQQKQ